MGTGAGENQNGLTTVTLRSIDDLEFQLPLSAARHSELCQQAIPEDVEEIASMEPIDLLRVGSRALEKVVAFLIQHDKEPLKEIPNPLPFATFNEVE
jgi:hypothetical protein